MPPPLSDTDPFSAPFSRKRRVSSTSLEIFKLPELQTNRSIHPLKRARIQELPPLSPTETREPPRPVSSTSTSSISSSDDDETSTEEVEDEDLIEEIESEDDVNSTSSEDGSETSSSSSSSSSDGDVEVPTVLQGSLQDRLSAFLPTLAAANRELERERQDGLLDQRDIERLDEEEEQYIEMDLGLGVLEEKTGSSSESKYEEESELEEGSGVEMLDVGEKREKDVMGRLLGRRSRGEPKPNIQVVESVS